MAYYGSNAVFTNAGVALLLKAQAGKCKIKITRMVTGDGEYTEEERTRDSLRKRTELKSLKQSFPFECVETINEKSIMVTANITNKTETEELNTGYKINEIGICAMEDGVEGTEVLYSFIVVDIPDFMPPYNGLDPAIFIQDYYISVDDSENVTIVIAPFNEEINKLKKEISILKENKAEKPTIKEIIIPADAWDETLTANVPADFLTGAADEVILAWISETAVPEQVDAWISAGVVQAKNTEGNIMFKGNGDKPLVDIPVTLFIHGGLSGTLPVPPPEGGTCDCEEITDEEIKNVVGSYVPGGGGSYIEEVTDEEIKDVVEGE